MSSPGNTFVYVFTGSVAEHFGYLPADPPSQWLEPGATVVCTAPVEHARLKLLSKPKAKRKAKPKPTVAPRAPSRPKTPEPIAAEAAPTKAQATVDSSSEVTKDSK